MAVKWKGAFVESVRAIHDRRITKRRSTRRVARLADGRINPHRTVGDWTRSADWPDPGLRRHGGRGRFHSHHHACHAERNREERHPAYGHQRCPGLAGRRSSLFRRRVRLCIQIQRLQPPHLSPSLARRTQATEGLVLYPFRGRGPAGDHCFADHWIDLSDETPDLLYPIVLRGLSRIALVLWGRR